MEEAPEAFAPFAQKTINSLLLSQSTKLEQAVYLSGLDSAGRLRCRQWNTLSILSFSMCLRPYLHITIRTWA